jgi:hypothetical protein
MSEALGEPVELHRATHEETVMFNAKPGDHPKPRVRPEYEASPGESQADALRCEIMILIDYALDVGMDDDVINDVFLEVFNARSREQRQAFEVRPGGRKHSTWTPPRAAFPDACQNRRPHPSEE